ncbi:hypothetical protein [Veillonella sp. VA142]|uniref:hypothetical protein n=1 Tax=Veillonella sp. VA142 TaxID=741834 RepID=UPI000F8E309F|nr:hypothetical protein [Veillonella sp. VA142]
MTKLVKFNERRVVDGFTFQKGWWGEFSPTGELVTAYAYPRVEVNHSDWSYSWKFAKIFYPMDGGFVGDLELGYKLPAEVMGDFDVVAEQDMLEQKQVFFEIYGE